MRKLLVGLLVMVLSLTGCTARTATTPAPAASSAATSSAAAADSALPSWNDTAARNNIVDYVKRVTTEGGPDFVPVSDRIAVFDNDGTLWAEAPMPFQVAFAVDEVKARAQTDPALAADPMVQAAINGDVGALQAGDRHDGLMHILALTHTGMTTAEFDKQVSDWLTTAKHPRFGRSYDQLTYQPQQELLKYLRANGFRTYIVSGGGADFMRVFAERVYGIPPEQVVGSTATVKFEMRDGKPVLVKTADYVFVDDKDGKPAGIHEFIGKRPIMAIGNSDGDQAMIEYTTIDNPRPSLGVLVHHTDADREYAYDANPPSSGRLVTALQEAHTRDWTVVDMKRDWNTVFAAP